MSQEVKLSISLMEQAIEKVSERAHMTREREIKRIIEALLFSSGEAISIEKIKEVVQTSYPIRSREIEELIEELCQEYREQQRAFQIEQIAGGFLLRTSPEMYPFLEHFYMDKRGEKLSKAATEVLAIIAFRNPITKREIEKIRGVDCSGTMAALLERGLIEPVGRKEAPGRPMQYGVTKQFLQHFGLKNLQELTVHA
jgi:segregation and condensation protein B